MKKYRWFIGLITQDGEKIDKSDVVDYVKDVFRNSGCNVEELTGTWKGETEPALKVEHVAFEDFSEEDAETLKTALEQEFNQESVLCEEDETTVIA